MYEVQKKEYSKIHNISKLGRIHCLPQNFQRKNMKLKYFLQWLIIPAKDKQTTLSKNTRQTV